MSENQTPSTPATEAAPVIPEAKGAPVVETKTSEAAPAKTEAKADVAADKAGAEKVATDQYELKVDGEILTLTKDEMIKWAQLGKAGQKKMQEAAEYRKSVETDLARLAKQLKEDPGSVLEDENIGHKKIELAKKWLAEQMELDAKSPEQIELETLRKENAKIKAEKEAELKKAKEEAEARETEQNIQALEKEMLTAFKKYNLPNSGAIVDRMTGIMEFSERNGINASIDDIAKVVKDEIKKDLQEQAAMLSDEDFEDLLGEVGIKRVKESTLKKMKSVSKVDTTETSKVKPKEPERKKVDIKDWMKPSFDKVD